MLRLSRHPLSLTLLVALLSFAALLAVPTHAATGTCTAANCAQCVAGSTSACEVCNGNYQRGTDGVSCVAMECKIAHCAVCVTEMTAQCETCSTNYELYAKGLMCVLGECTVANCSKCVDGTVDQCASCASGYEVRNAACAAVKSSSSLSTGAIVGIAVGASVFVILVVLLIVLLVCCCRKRKVPSLHAVETDEGPRVNPLAGRPSQCREMDPRNNAVPFDTRRSLDEQVPYVDGDSTSNSDSDEDVESHVSLYSHRSRRSTRRESARRGSARQVYTMLIDGEYNGDSSEDDDDVFV